MKLALVVDNYVVKNTVHHPYCVYTGYPNIIQNWNANLGFAKLHTKLFGGDKYCRETSIDSHAKIPTHVQTPCLHNTRGQKHRAKKKQQKSALALGQSLRK